MEIDGFFQKLTTKIKNWGSNASLIYNIVALNNGLFEYENIEKVLGLNSENFEMALFLYPNLCLYATPELEQKIHVLRWDITGLNENLLPSKVNLLFLDGKLYKQEVDYKDIILLKDNSLGLPPYIAIKEYIDKLEKIDDSIGKILTLKTLPLGAVGNKKQVKAFKEIARQFGEEKRIIAIADNDIVDKLQPFNIQVNTTLQELYDLKENYIKECYNAIGISYNKVKKERLITDEVASDNDNSNMKYQSRWYYRKKAIDLVNKISKVKIKFNPLYDIFEKDTQNDIKEKGELNNGK